jgi:hypothetical protein
MSASAVPRRRLFFGLHKLFPGCETLLKAFFDFDGI